MELINEECLSAMRAMQENSVDTIITDPPYGLKFLGKKWDYDVPGIEIWEEALRVAKPGALLFSFSGSRTFARTSVRIEDAGWLPIDTIIYMFGSGFPKSHDISKAIDRKLGAYRPPLFRNPNSREQCDKSNTIYESGTVGKTDYITEPSTKEAKLWEGWKTGLKPAFEPILVFMKPKEGSFAENAMKWGVAGYNIDGARIGKGTGELKKISIPNMSGSGTLTAHGKKRNQMVEALTFDKGRYPANVILDDDAGALLDEQSGIESSRFFYVAKASKKEKNVGLEEMPEKVKLYNGTSNKPCKNMNSLQKRWTTTMQNHHPTVKPLSLIRYLCRLSKTPTGGTVLDPFMGSGTSGLAALQEERDFIGIEKDKDYFQIAKQRILYYIQGEIKFDEDDQFLVF